ncbi:anillin-like [Polyergus mexicanus]|uniref:anillin-like n=1 Tax=Polyergus mexicanus TaxID=615972 RepID=UPI0038B5411E
MEPFIQRLLERAKARREKLDEQLVNAGHDVKRRSPLKGNIQLEQITVKATNTANENSVKSPKVIATETPIKSSDTFFLSENITSKNNEQDNKENDEFGTSNVRSKLQRLGKLYSEDNNLGSPIHRTEEKFSAEENDIEHKPIKRGARLDRLAALASTINNWEDDLSHPTLNNSKIKPVNNKAERIQAKFNVQVKSIEPQPSTSKSCILIAASNKTKSEDTSLVKQLKLDKTVLENLEAQGFSRTESNSRLVYDYKHCSQESTNAMTSHLSPKKLTSSTQMEKKRISFEKFDGSPRSKKTEDGTGNSVSNTPENIVKGANTTSSSRLPSRTGFNGSPKTLVQPSGSVLSKASMFEAKNMDTKAKDPAQMSVAERTAFFERNKGEAPLIPKAPLTMSIPPKKLQENNKLNTQLGSNVSNSIVHDVNNRNVDTSNKSCSVLEQRAMFEQGSNKNKVEDMENHILQATCSERQRELNMLRSRFNNNKEIARAAAKSCVRTSESSEGGGKSSSPKNSPICPVKPTPAPDHITPPPPPPPPPEIVSYYSKSPIKRQVIGSPPKVQHLNTVFCDSNVKRVRVCIPKPGSLYPNLSEIETTESGSSSEYTVDSTEPVTATLDEETETESGTVTEADYYIQNDETDQETSESDRESTQTSSIGRTSLGRTILNAFNERSLFNKKRSMEPDLDSTTSDISALDEMDQYLDECFDMEDNNVKEEGPTPPKVNKGQKSLLTACNSFKYRSPLKDSDRLEDGDKCTPLVRTVSAYRREQFQLAKANSAARPEAESDPVYNHTEKCEDESVLVENKVKKLLDEVVRQNKKIEEASKALNLCKASIEFNGSSEHVGGEWALLVATRKRQAALNEVQRLKREGSLRPVKAGSPDMGSGTLSISAITLSLKPEYIRHMGLDKYLYCVCLMYHLGEVIATQAAIAEPRDSCIRFPSMLKFENLHSDFEIDVEVYSLQTQPKFLPHEKKYHINHHNIKAMNKTPKKKNQFVMPDIQSPAGPHVIRSPAFELSGTTTITINDINCEQFALYGISSHSPLEGLLRMRVSRKLSVSIEHRGFLTLFEDVSNLGAWYRRWYWLKDAKLYFWVHPEDEHKKNPIGYLDLKGVLTKNVQFVNREKCARPFTFVLETSRQAQPGDHDSLVMKTNGIETTIEHFLLADTKEEGLQWMSKLNKTLSLIRAWGL